ncbi:MAG TPA: hypothetical protein VGB13_05890, partial [Candidatus Krumholzibacteria bacterium]
LLGVLLSRVKTGTNIDDEVHAYLAKFFEEKDFFSTQITDSVRHREATFRRQSVHECSPKDDASKQYMAVVDELLEKLGNPKPVESAEAPANDAPPRAGSKAEAAG